MNAKTKKIATAATAVVLSASLLLGGTFAWQSVNQTARNVAEEEVNPGGRLHDDFNGTNKDVYVENFTNAEDGGQVIYTRVRLDEYLQVTSGSNTYVYGADEDADISPVQGQPATYVTYKPGEALVDSANEFRQSVDWTFGGETVYMPTFNMNKDSLAADVNGTIEGPDKLYPTEENDSGDKYGDYVTYDVGDTVYLYEVTDLDTNGNDELPDAGDVAEVISTGIIPDAADGAIAVSEQTTHTAQTTSSATVMTMQEWLALSEDEQVGDYWVYDTDGWAYYARGIEPGEATGLLLTGIEVNTDDSYYYAINVVAQFVTANDLGYEDSTGFYDTTKGTEPSENALTLLEAIGVNTAAGDEESEEDEEPKISFRIYGRNTDEGINYADGETVVLESADTYTIYVQDAAGGSYAGEYPYNYVWEVTPTDLEVTPNEVTANEDAFYVGADFVLNDSVPAGTYTITATNTEDGDVRTAYIEWVGETDAPDIDGDFSVTGEDGAVEYFYSTNRINLGQGTWTIALENFEGVENWYWKETNDQLGISATDSANARSVDITITGLPMDKGYWTVQVWNSDTNEVIRTLEIAFAEPAMDLGIIVNNTVYTGLVYGVAAQNLGNSNLDEYTVEPVDGGPAIDGGTFYSGGNLYIGSEQEPGQIVLVATSDVGEVRETLTVVKSDDAENVCGIYVDGVLTSSRTLLPTNEVTLSFSGLGDDLELTVTNESGADITNVVWNDDTNTLAVPAMEEGGAWLLTAKDSQGVTAKAEIKVSTLLWIYSTADGEYTIDGRTLYNGDTLYARNECWSEQEGEVFTSDNEAVTFDSNGNMTVTENAQNVTIIASVPGTSMTSEVMVDVVAETRPEKQYISLTVEDNEGNEYSAPAAGVLYLEPGKTYTVTADPEVVSYWFVLYSGETTYEQSEDAQTLTVTIDKDETGYNGKGFVHIGAAPQDPGLYYRTEFDIDVDGDLQITQVGDAAVTDTEANEFVVESWPASAEDSVQLKAIYTDKGGSVDVTNNADWEVRRGAEEEYANEVIYDDNHIVTVENGALKNSGGFDDSYLGIFVRVSYKDITDEIWLYPET